MTTNDYPDSNNNGIPDAFENRRPIVEILRESEPIAASVINENLSGFVSVEKLVEAFDAVRAHLKEVEEESKAHQECLRALENDYRELREHYERLLACKEPHPFDFPFIGPIPPVKLGR